MPPFDPTDPQYQLSSEHPPDKEPAWPYPPAKDGWCLAHNALKGEIRIFTEALETQKARGTGLAGWEVESIKTVFAGHCEHVRCHHHNEDNNFVPLIKKRVVYPEKLEVDHPVIEEQFSKVEAMIQELKEGDNIDNVLVEWTKYSDMIVPHMDEEEVTALLLMRAYFKPADIKPAIEEIVKKGPKIEMGSFIYFMGVDKFRKEFMAQEGIPFFVWYIDFQYRLREFEERVVKHMDALKAGKEPEDIQASWCNIMQKFGVGC